MGKRLSVDREGAESPRHDRKPKAGAGEAKNFRLEKKKKCKSGCEELKHRRLILSKDGLKPPHSKMEVIMKRH